MLDIHWSSEGTDYCIKYSHMRIYGGWNYVTTAFYILPLENRTYELTIALHPVMNMVSKFTIGKCRATGLVLKNSDIWLKLEFCVIWQNKWVKNVTCRLLETWVMYWHACKDHKTIIPKAWKKLVTVWNIQTHVRALSKNYELVRQGSSRIKQSWISGW